MATDQVLHYLLRAASDQFLHYLLRAASDQSIHSLLRVGTNQFLPVCRERRLIIFFLFAESDV